MHQTTTTEPSVPASPPERPGATFGNGLLAVLVADRQTHPERTAATIGRIHEVVGPVAADQSTEVEAEGGAS